MGYYTIGIAGHIDHGKTTLTKALTNVDTDRLKEEKERNISIELGYAPFQIKENYHVSIIDVPGHEKFIRQMIAGVTGIDLVLVVVAADEGLMPQTKEHFEILSLLGIKQAIIVVTKADLVDDEQLELASEEIRDYVNDTDFKTAEIVYVDGVSKRGISTLNEKIIGNLDQLQKRDDKGALRLPVDQVFTLQGHGTILRGTLHDGTITAGQSITILPDGYKGKVRQLQSQNKTVTKAFPGQRVAINISGIDRGKLQRGHVIVDSGHYAISECIDVIIRTTRLMELPLKQRTLVKLHIGTSEVMGKIVFFDRNTLEAVAEEEVYCQIRLDEPIVAKKGDRFILRRPSPTETFAGGKVINVNGGKYHFGSKTINMLKQMEKGSLLDQLISLLEEHKLLSYENMIKQLGLTKQELNQLLEEGVAAGQIIKLSGQIFAYTVVKQLDDDVLLHLEQYHIQNPLRHGIPKAELIQTYKKSYPEKLVNAVFDQLKINNDICLNGPNIYLNTFQPALPKQWEKRMNGVIDKLEEQGLEPKPIEELTVQAEIPDKIAKEFINYLKNEQIVDKLDEKHLIHHKVLHHTTHVLKDEYPDSFTLQEAKSVLNVSRKYLVLILELLDRKKVTIRNDQKRKWTAI
ncbi:selenocysteine-specific translation elongation factor [Metabacillus herbersteinensis]|uniref:Selenocysteine-specific elongation factor n=1 Tax=Metabacillus herbersteinensis TaxID=283816 RepID=A0ABV6GB79_9BACI